MIVQPSSCAATDRRGLSIHLVSRPVTVDQHLQRVNILPGFQLQCPIAGAHEISANALCPLHVSSGQIPHSSGTFLDTELNVWAFFGEKHQFAHNRTVLFVFSWTKQRFLVRNSRLRSHTKRMHWMAILQTSTGQQTVEELRKRLDLKSPLSLDQQSPEKLCFRPQLWTTGLQKEDLAIAVRVLSRALSGPTNTPSSICLHHDTREF